MASEVGKASSVNFSLPRATDLFHVDGARLLLADFKILCARCALFSSSSRLSCFAASMIFLLRAFSIATLFCARTLYCASHRLRSSASFSLHCACAYSSFDESCYLGLAHELYLYSSFNFDFAHFDLNGSNLTVILSKSLGSSFKGGSGSNSSSTASESGSVLVTGLPIKFKSSCGVAFTRSCAAEHV